MGDLSCDRFGLKFDAHEVRLSKMSTVDETLSLFFRSYFFRKDLRQRVRRSRAAVVIQRAFRRYLYRKDQVIFAQSRAAILFQRCWRRYYRRQKIIQRILSTYPAEQLPYQLQMKLPKKKPVAPPSPRRVGKRKVLVELKPPWGDKKPNKLSPRDIENLMNEQKDDVTWVTKQIMPMFMQYLNKVLNGREKLQRQNKDYQEVMIYLNLADDYFKAVQEARRLKDKNEDLEKEVYSLKHELIGVQMKLDAAREESK